MNNSDIMIRFSKELITEWTFAMLFISIFLECNLVISKSNSIVRMFIKINCVPTYLKLFERGWLHRFSCFWLLKWQISAIRFLKPLGSYLHSGFFLYSQSRLSNHLFTSPAVASRWLFRVDQFPGFYSIITCSMRCRRQGGKYHKPCLLLSGHCNIFLNHSHVKYTFNTSRPFPKTEKSLFT